MELVKVASKACDSCRKLRVGCDREIPSCGRCRNSKLNCSYLHQLKRETAKPRNKVNGFDVDAHLQTYRAFQPPVSSNTPPRPLVLKWVEGASSLPKNKIRKRFHDLDESPIIKYTTSTTKNSSKQLVRLVSKLTSRNITTSLPRMLTMLLGTRNMSFPIIEVNQKSQPTLSFKETVVVIGNIDINSTWHNLYQQAIDNYFKYDNSLEVLFLSKQSYESQVRCKLLQMSIFLAGIRYITNINKSVSLEILAMVTNELRSVYNKSSLGVIQALIILYHTYATHLLNPLVSTCLNLATSHCHSLGLHLSPNKSTTFRDLERQLAYRALFNIDTTSTYALDTHPCLPDDLIPTFKLDYSNLKNSLLFDENTQCLLIISDFHLSDNKVMRKLVNFRNQSQLRQDTVIGLESDFRRGCIAHLSKLYGLLNQSHSTTSSLVPMAINYIALRLHMWIVVLYTYEPKDSHRLASALLSAQRLLDHHESFRNQPYFLSGTIFVSSALLHLHHLNFPGAQIQVAHRALIRLQQFESIWPLSKHLQLPIRNRAKELGLTL